jgi:hypothetical protein
MPANELLTEIHNAKQRMPLILPPEAVDIWQEVLAADGRISILLIPWRHFRCRTSLPRGRDITEQIGRLLTMDSGWLSGECVHGIKYRVRSRNHGSYYARNR